MSESKHTPGPWVANIPPTDRMAPTVDAVDGEVCTCECGVNRTNRYNARLIAAAPELLEACEAAMLKIEAYEECVPGEVIAAEDMPEEWELCRAAIAKAKPDA